MLEDEYWKPHLHIVTGASVLCRDQNEQSLPSPPAVSRDRLHNCWQSFASPLTDCMIVHNSPRSTSELASRWLCRTVLLEALITRHSTHDPSPSKSGRRKTSMRAKAWGGEVTWSTGPTGTWGGDSGGFSRLVEKELPGWRQSLWQVTRYCWVGL